MNELEQAVSITIGFNHMIGVGSVVTKDIPSSVVQVIRKIEESENDEKQSLLCYECR